MPQENTIDYQSLQQILPQTYPFIMLDHVENYVINKSLVAVKNITANEWVFDSPNDCNLIFPEVFLIEVAAQAAIVLYHVSQENKMSAAKPKYILGRTTAEFFCVVTAGDRVEVVVHSGKILESGGYSSICIKVGNITIANLEMIFKVRWMGF